MSAIVWFRKDLRLSDNPAFEAAMSHHETVLPLYIRDLNHPLLLGEAQQWWLHQSLQTLNRLLKQHDLSLILKSGDTLSILSQLIEKHRIDAIYWNHNYEPEGLTQDDNLAEALSDLNIQIKGYNASLLIDLDKIKTKSGDPYKVFTPFWREALTTIPEKPYGSVNRTAKPIDEPSEPLNSWALLPHSSNWAAGFEPIWQPGEQGAIKQLNFFMENGIHGYKQNRNVPALKATSRLSPHLHFGEISPYAIWRSVQSAKSSGEWLESDLETFLSELGWREFSYYLKVIGVHKLDKLVISNIDLDYPGGLDTLENHLLVNELGVEDHSFYQKGMNCHHYPDWEYKGVHFEFLALPKSLKGKKQPFLYSKNL